MICPYCCREVGNNYLCPYCKTMLRSPTPADLDRGGILPILLGLTLPGIGVILGAVWRNSKPKSSRQIFIASIISIVGYAIGSMLLMYAYYAIYLPSLFESIL